MKNLTLSALGALSLTLACSNVFAVDGTITINGVVTDETCTLEGSGGGASGARNLTLNLDSVKKSAFSDTTKTAGQKSFSLQLKNAAGTAGCDAATNLSLKGLFLSAINATDLDTTDKTLLVNKVSDASTTNPVFIQILTNNDALVNLNEAWGTQAKSDVTGLAADGTGIATMSYKAQYFTKSGTVDAQQVNATLNYTLQYN